jgi:hypothetical protein
MTPPYTGVPMGRNPRDMRFATNSGSKHGVQQKSPSKLMKQVKIYGYEKETDNTSFTACKIKESTMLSIDDYLKENPSNYHAGKWQVLWFSWADRQRA